ncbi:cell division protein ZapA [Emcibacter sp.]|uniref:cell division protein ZapA n=1 Tax=Emcibacter sp. TaxID=1979954 RepID=UPI003A9547F6
MAETIVTFNNKSYHLACRNGEEERLRNLAEFIDAKADQLKSQMGAITDSRLMLMTAILLADELDDLKNGSLDLDSPALYEKTLSQAVKKVENLARTLEGV